MSENNTRVNENDQINVTDVQKERIFELLREQGCRITKQRKVLIDIILTGNYSCSKEIYYAASKIDSNIGAATVYRMINTLEEIGAINRKNMFKVTCCEACEVDGECGINIPMNCTGRLMPNTCEITYANGNVIKLSAGDWYRVVKEGLKSIGEESREIITGINIIPAER